MYSLLEWLQGHNGLVIITKRGSDSLIIWNVLVNYLEWGGVQLLQGLMHSGRPGLNEWLCYCLQAKSAWCCPSHLVMSQHQHIQDESWISFHLSSQANPNL